MMESIATTWSKLPNCESSMSPLRKSIEPFPSDANMILVRVADAKRAFDGMKARGVLVKNIAAMHPLLANCLRLTVGTPEENTLMIQALKESL